jgi:hypothetical protein
VKKSKTIPIILCTILLVAAAIYYYLPVKINKEISACSLDGDQIKLVLDLSWHRSLLKPTELRGKIGIDNNEYLSLLDTDVKINKYSFWEGLKMKVKGERYIPPWFVVSDKDLMDMDKITLSPFDINFNLVEIHVYVEKPYDSYEVPIYYGPANTAQEADKVMRQIHHKE